MYRLVSIFYTVGVRNTWVNLIIVCRLYSSNTYAIVLHFSTIFTTPESWKGPSSLMVPCGSHGSYAYATLFFSIIIFAISVKRMPRRRAAYLPVIVHWARRWIYRSACDVWQVRRQAYNCLPRQRTLPLLLGRYSFSIHRGQEACSSAWVAGCIPRRFTRGRLAISVLTGIDVE